MSTEPVAGLAAIPETEAFQFQDRINREEQDARTAIIRKSLES